MTEKMNGDSQIEQQWSLLEKQHLNNRPVAACLVGIRDGKMLVDVGGVQGYIEHFVYAFTKSSSNEFLAEEPSISIVELAQQRLMDIEGEIAVLRIIDIDRGKRHLKLSQDLHQNGGARIEDFDRGTAYIGIITSINPIYMKVDLSGVAGKIFLKGYKSNKSKDVDTKTTFRVGQEVKVNVIKKQGNSLLLTLDDTDDSV